jgi:hypothetical protein
MAFCDGSIGGFIFQQIGHHLYYIRNFNCLRLQLKAVNWQLYLVLQFHILLCIAVLILK